MITIPYSSRPPDHTSIYIQPGPSMTSLVCSDPSKMVCSDPRITTNHSRRITTNHFRRITTNLGHHWRSRLYILCHQPSLPDLSHSCKLTYTCTIKEFQVFSYVMYVCVRRRIQSKATLTRGLMRWHHQKFDLFASFQAQHRIIRLVNFSNLSTKQT